VSERREKIANMKYSRVHRLLRIITIAQGSSVHAAASLAEQCGVSIRSIFDDIRLIAEAGVPIYFDNERRGYQIRRDFFVRPVDLTIEESLALALLAQQIGKHEQVAYARPAHTAVEKLLAGLPSAIREHIDSSVPFISIRLARSSNEAAKDVYAVVHQAIINRRALRCDYESATRRGASAGEFRFDPYGLYYGQRAWYVIGKHHVHNKVRTLKLSRFTCCRPTQQPFAIPDGFSIDRHFAGAWRMMPDPEVYEIELRFSTEVSENVADTHWHDSQEIEWHDDDSITMRLRVAGLREIIWWILSYGPNCRVIKPAVLRKQVQDLARKTAKQYGRQGGRAKAMLPG